MENTEITLFENLIKVYETYYQNLYQAKWIVKKYVNEENWGKASDKSIEVNLNETFVYELKKILQKHFKTHIEMEIPKLETIYQKEHDYAKSAWESYGSELAGDFNKGEVDAEWKLQLFKDLLK